MRLPTKTQSGIEATDSKLDYIRANYFQGLLTDSELLDAYRNLGYSEQGAKRAASWIMNTGEAYREQHKIDHPSLY